MRCEALWILTNIAAVPEDECVQMILASKLVYDEDTYEENYQIDMQYKKSALLRYIDDWMKTFIQEGCKDFKTMNLILLFLRNVAESGA